MPFGQYALSGSGPGYIQLYFIMKTLASAKEQCRFSKLSETLGAVESHMAKPSTERFVLQNKMPIDF